MSCASKKMQINTFGQICLAMSLGPAHPRIVLSESSPRLIARYLAPSAGREEAIVVDMGDSPIHVTIYKSSWDGEVTLPWNMGLVPVGPHSLHLSAKKRWFFSDVEQDGSLISLYPEIGDDPADGTPRVLDSVFMPVLGKYLFSAVPQR